VVRHRIYGYLAVTMPSVFTENSSAATYIAEFSPDRNRGFMTTVGFRRQKINHRGYSHRPACITAAT
jgi:hypothetical protein